MVVIHDPSSITVLGPILVMVTGALYTFKYLQAWRETRKVKATTK